MGIEPTLSAWKAEVLPLNYTRISEARRYKTKRLPLGKYALSCNVYSLMWRGKDSNLRRQSRQIYSLIPLTAREPLQKLA